MLYPESLNIRKTSQFVKRYKIRIDNQVLKPRRGKNAK